MSHDPRSQERIFSREQAIAILNRIGIREGEADRLLKGLTFPITLTELQEHLAQYGITHDSLMSDFGGSP